MINQIAKLKNRHWLPALGLAATVGLFSACEKDVLEGQPSWLGNSIYERLSEGIEVNGQKKSFNTMIRLIEDLDQKEVLSKTGSKTLFVADDEAFQQWFQTNSWGVRSYEELSPNQRTMLLNNAMINNAYLLELMANVSGNPPQAGLCMRRLTASTIYDTVYSIAPQDMPVDAMQNPLFDVWSSYRERNKTLKLFKDNTSAPMIHFLPRFMTKNNITDSDLEKLTNGKSTSISDSWINGRKVISTEQTCKNGYIYVVDGVIEPSQSMSEIIMNNPKTQLWGKMLQRFTVPIYDATHSREYNRINGTNDSIFTLRYFSDYAPLQSGSKGMLIHLPDNDDYVVPGRLAFDPGWNQYMYKNPMGYDLYYDAGAMIVPTDDAVRSWWNGAGSGLKQEYGELDSLPISTLAVLLRVHMLPSFIESVPSKFRSIVDDAKVELGIRPDDVKEAYMGCNGVVYVSDKVFPPSEFRSVVYPALASQSLMGVIYRAVKNYDYGPFLNSMESQFTMILPNNTGRSINPAKTEAKYLQYLDPCTYGMPQQILYEFYFDEKSQIVCADRYIVTVDADGQIHWEGGAANSMSTVKCEQSHFDASGVHTYSSKSVPCIVSNRLSDMVNNLIIIGRLNPTQKFYKTKAGSTIYVDYQDDEHIRIAGGLQYKFGNFINPLRAYDMTQGSKGNGVSYGTQEVPMTSDQSVFEVLKAHAKADADCTCAADSAYRLFFELLQGDNTSGSLLKAADGSYVCANNENDANKNIRIFDNYNYTVYVPTNAAIRELIAKGYLPTWDDYEANESDEKASAFIAERIENFLRYHIQDNSLYYEGPSYTAEKFETSKLNEQTRRFYSVSVTSDQSGIEVTDQLGRSAHVLREEGLYNNPCREYWIEMLAGSVKGVRATRTLISSSNAVVHQIDNTLIYDESMLQSWTSEMRK